MARASFFGAALALAAAALGGCVTRDPPPAKVAVAPPVPLPPPPKVTGKLLFFDWRSGFSICARTGDDLEATCSAASIPGAPGHMEIAWRNAPGQYLVPLGDDPKTAGMGLWDAAASSVKPLRGIQFDRFEAPILVLGDGSMLRQQALSTFTRVLRAKPGGPFLPIASLDALHGYEHRFSPAGQVMFKRTPGMGGAESEFFIDVVKNSSTALYYAPSLDAPPKRLATRDQFMEADFIDGGRSIAYFRPGVADEKKNERTFTLETVDTDTAAEHAWGEVKAPLKGSSMGRPVYFRAAPPAVFFPQKPWILHGVAHDERFAPRVLRLVDVSTGERFDFALEENEALLEHVPRGGMVTLGYELGRSDAPVIVTCSGGETGLPRPCRVRALPSFEVVMTVNAPPFTAAADWLPDEPGAAQAR
jgi:hypothetical protein